jgi:hypothetical protein
MGNFISIPIYSLASEFSLPTINQALHEKLSKTKNTNGIDNYNCILLTVPYYVIYETQSSSIIFGYLSPKCGDLGLQVILHHYNSTMQLRESTFVIYTIYTADIWNKPY